jgi:hypothetical protein
MFACPSNSLTTLTYTPRFSRRVAAVWLTSLITEVFLGGLFSAISRTQNQLASTKSTLSVTLFSICIFAIVLGEGIGWLIRKSPQGVQKALRVGTQVLLLFVMFFCAGLLEQFGDGPQQGDSSLIGSILGYQTIALGALGTVILICIVNLPGRNKKEGPSD